MIKQPLEVGSQGGRPDKTSLLCLALTLPLPSSHSVLRTPLSDRFAQSN